MHLGPGKAQILWTFRFRNHHFHDLVHLHDLSSMYTQQLKQAQDNHQGYTLKTT